MSIFQRLVFLLKVLVLLAVGSSAAWAQCPDHDEQASNGKVTHTGLMIAQSSLPAVQPQGGSADDDESTTDDPDGDEDEGT